MNTLVIVESPAKAKTIEKYLGDNYIVRASVGHVRDLPKSSTNAIDIPGGFIPYYQVSPDKIKVISELKKITSRSDEVILATDLDREGEAIAWHIAEVLNLKNPKRIVFNEITKDAITEAITHPREIDIPLKEAQEARRVLDRLFGYELSGLIWKKVRYGLSAGRVQSPALRILMEREREIRAFIPETYYVLSGKFSHNKIQFILICDKEITSLEETENILNQGRAGSWHIVDIKETEAKRNPYAPFTTSTLQQTASTRLGFAPSRTMRAAQKLYEAGHITYMRTDSRNLGAQAIASIASLIEKEYGKNYVEIKNYSTTSKHAQEAHEAIRPTTVTKKNAGNTDDEQSLYELIWRRTVASQMVPAQLKKTKVSANITKQSIPNFSVNGQQVLFPGWLAVDTAARSDDTEVPQLVKGDTINLVSLDSEEKQTLPPSRYSEAGLIKELEKRGIGRPSTYASIITTIVDRGYVEKEGRTLKPTDVGDVVSTFVEDHFKKYISDDFTSEMENELDEIATGERTYKKTLTEFYTPFKKDIDAKENIEKLTNLGDAPKKFICPKCKSPMVYKLGRGGKFMSCFTYPVCDGALTVDGKEIKGTEPIGIHPETKLPIYVMNGRFGPYLQMGESQEKIKKADIKEEKARKKSMPKPKMVSIPPHIKPEDITFDQAIHLMILPRTLGNHPDDSVPIIANVGRFGPYVGHDREFRSIKKSSGLDPYTITLEQALKLLTEPKMLAKGTTLARVIGKHPKTGKEIQLLKSKSGYFMKKGLKRIYLPDKQDPEKLTLEEALEMMK